jgi:hypothetical protein
VTDLGLLWIPKLGELPDYGPWAREWIHDYVKEYHNRISFTPMNKAATAYLMAELESLGYESKIITYYPDLAPVGLGPVGYDVLVATRPGLVEPDRHIGLVAHHEARYTSNEASYDDGSGTAAVMALAKHFAEVETRKSITILLFDGEELGLKGSCYYVRDVVRAGAPLYDMVFGYDMVGINWPGHEWKLYQMMGDEWALDTILPLAEHVYRDVLELPEDGVEIMGEHDRNSDERRFRESGIPIYRWAGGRHAADYPHYHQPTDTYENMIEFAGGEKNFELGINAVIQTSIAMVHAVDQYRFPPQDLVEKPCSFYGPDNGPV